MQISSTKHSISQPGANLLVERLPVALCFFIFGAQFAVWHPVGIIQQHHIHLHEQKVSERNNSDGIIVRGLMGPQPRASVMDSCPARAPASTSCHGTISYWLWTFYNTCRNEKKSEESPRQNLRLSIIDFQLIVIRITCWGSKESVGFRKIYRLI